ncbi:hypothetical protein [Pseudaestuariivita atlantica]|uniref:hypothetical protein n=1 Tax=Pseudaestuariivita atlantica TaxID=1317121 RepID=UPI00067C6B36|nr:hypothetical protein [Pseudaestuariivita atlantica]
MTTLSIPAHAPGRIDVFSLDLPAAEAKRLLEDADALADLLGARPDPAQVETFDTAVLGDLGLAGYLVEGMGVAAEDVAPHSADLGNISHAVVVRAAGFGGRAVTLTPRPPLNHVVTLTEENARIDLTPLRSAGAEGHVPPPDVPPAAGPRISRWLWLCVALAALLLIASVLPVFVSF